MTTLRLPVIGAIAAVLLSGGAFPAQAAPPADHPAPVGAPRTLAQSVAASADTRTPGFPIDYVGVTWAGEHAEVLVRFRHGARWTPWQAMGEDGVQEEGRFTSALVSGGDADAYQVRVPPGVRGPRSVAINTTDGPTTTASSTSTAATCAAQTTLSFDYVDRCEWGADESLRLDRRGRESWPAEYFPVQQLTVHHTAGSNSLDEDPEAALRAIYRYHTIDNGWGDIGYQYVVDRFGNVYEGRHTDDDPDTMPGYGTGDDTNSGVVGAHVGNWNSGNMGVSLMGTFTTQEPTAEAVDGLERVLVELSTRSGVDPDTEHTYVNPSSGASWSGWTVAAHRDFAATECPGGLLYAMLPGIRSAVAAAVPPAGTVVTDGTPPVISEAVVSPKGSRATVSWDTDEPADSQVEYWPADTTSAVTKTPLDTQLVRSHSVQLSGLRKGTTYGYQVRSADRSGNVSYSPVDEFTAG